MRGCYCCELGGRHSQRNTYCHQFIDPVRTGMPLEHRATTVRREFGSEGVIVQHVAQQIPHLASILSDEEIGTRPE
jgi:hypothetical protein